MPRTDLHHEHLVEAEGADDTEPIGIIIDQGGAIGDDRVVDGVPVAADLDGHLIDASGIAAHLLSHPPTRTVGHGLPGCTDAKFFTDPRHRRTRLLGATPPMLVPHQSRRATEARQVHQLHDGPVLHMGEHAASGTTRPTGSDFDVDSKWLAIHIVEAEDVHLGQADQQLAHARRIRLHRGSSILKALETVRLAGPLLRARDPYTPLISEAPELAGAA